MSISRESTLKKWEINCPGRRGERKTKHRKVYSAAECKRDCILYSMVMDSVDKPWETSYCLCNLTTWVYYYKTWMYQKARGQRINKIRNIAGIMYQLIAFQAAFECLNQHLISDMLHAFHALSINNQSSIGFTFCTFAWKENILFHFTTFGSSVYTFPYNLAYIQHHKYDHNWNLARRVRVNILVNEENRVSKRRQRRYFAEDSC